MTQEDVTLFNLSLDRCNTHEGFLNLFCERFLASSEAIREKFQHVNLEKTQHMIKTSLYMIIMASDGNILARAYLSSLAEAHRHKNITPEMYQHWKTALMEAVRECDPKFNKVIETTWLETVDFGIEVMMHKTQV